MARILLVVHDNETRNSYATALHSCGVDFTATSPANPALRRILSDGVDVVVLDGAHHDATFARELRAAQRRTTLLIVAGVDSLRAAAEALRIGRPCGSHSHSAGGWPATSGEESEDCEAHATKRWATTIVEATYSTGDPKTLHRWARDIGVSYGALRNWCRTARFSAKESLQFARLLRAVILWQTTRRRFEDLLDVVDLRTLRRLLQRGGLDPVGLQGGSVEEAVERFLENQTLIRDRNALALIRHELRERLASLRVDGAPTARMVS